MDSLGKAIYMACFAFMFVLAASISIYLYTTLYTAHRRTPYTLIDWVNKWLIE